MFSHLFLLQIPNVHNFVRINPQFYLVNPSDLVVYPLFIG